MIYMLDANVIRHLVQEPDKATKIAAKIESIGPDRITLSTVVAQEIGVAVLNTKLSKANREALQSILRYFSMVAFDDRAASHSAYVESELRKAGTVIGKADMLIAGHARGLGMTLVTDNTREFKRIRGLNLENWASD